MSYPKNQPKPQVAPQQTATRIQQVQVETAGPIPDPTTLQMYNQIQPDFAERIMVMAEKEQSNRHLNDETLLSNQHTQHKRDTDTYRIGQYLGLASVCGIIALCAYCLKLGHATQAASIACTVIVGLAAAFVVNNQKKKEE